MGNNDMARFALTAIGGLIPFGGGLAGAASAEWQRREQAGWRELVEEWMRLREDETKEILGTLEDILVRLDVNDEATKARMKSPEYHAILRRCFRNWAGAESEEKRTILRNILTNAAGSRLASDDQVKLFTDWVGKYSEVHFKVIRSLYRREVATRGEMWNDIHGGLAADDSAEADLFKWVTHELSVGHIIRQVRETDSAGRFLTKPRPRHRRGQGREVMTSAFDNEKPYVLTALGQQFVHYGLTETVRKVGHETGEEWSG